MNKPSIIASKNNLSIIPFEIQTPFEIGSVNIYLILGNKITLVDTGPKTDFAWKSLIYQLNKNGLRIKDIDNVLLTHHHVDHIGLTSVLLQHHPKLKVFAHRMSAPWIEKRPETVKYYDQFFQEMYSENGLTKILLEEVKKYGNYVDELVEPVKVDEIVGEGSILDGLPNWKVIHNPGHSQGHISYYNEDKQILIAGDHLIAHTSSGVFIEPPLKKGDPRPKYLVNYQQSLQRLKKMKIKQLLSGHGQSITNVVQTVDKQLNKIEQRKNNIKKFLVNKPVTILDIMKLAYPKRYEKFILLYFSGILGYLDLLEDEGVVASIKDSGLTKYYIINDNK